MLIEIRYIHSTLVAWKTFRREEEWGARGRDVPATQATTLATHRFYFALNSECVSGFFY